MNWEFLGKQEMRDSSEPGKGYVYSIAMWRTPVPNGWLLMTLNMRSNSPAPVVCFYPDPDHVWPGNAPPEASYLLRPAGPGAGTAPDQLLRPSSEDDQKPKRIEK